MISAEPARRSSTLEALPAAIREVVSEFERTHRCGVRLWTEGRRGWDLLHPEAASVTHPGPTALPVERPGGDLRVEVVNAGPIDVEAAASFLAGVLARLIRHGGEVDFFSRELAERYEEITLLYSISEILGSLISLEEAAGTILREVVEVVGARRAALWVHNGETDHLELVAAVGQMRTTAPIPVTDRIALTAEVFRTRKPVVLSHGEEFPRGEFEPVAASRDSFLSVPVVYSPPDGEARPVGVINLAGRTTDEPFTAGDVKLLSAIASQVGAAVENNRLVAASLRQERVFREMELAHDLQLKLLPPVEPFKERARVAARCVPAESVGGDFYHLFNLPGRRLGVMIGDVSSHGFGAALIMALTMSALAIHAAEGDPPAHVLRRIHRALIDELRSTEMYFTLFYGVIDADAGTLVYANAGHPHAFRVTSDGHAERLGATGLPLGIAEKDRFEEKTVTWCTGEDLLFLFTDGITGALAGGERASERRLLSEVCTNVRRTPEEILERVFALNDGRSETPPDDRTAVLVRT